MQNTQGTIQQEFEKIMVVNPYSVDFVPSGTSTCNVVNLPASGTIPIDLLFGWSHCWLSSIDIEDDKVYQANVRKIRYSPFHLVTGHAFSKTINPKRKPLFVRQIMNKPFRIGKT